MNASVQPRLRALFAAAVLGLAGGCMHPGPHDAARLGPYYEPKNIMAEPNLGGLRRVVVLPVWSGNVAPAETAAELDLEVANALQRTHRFEVVHVSREDSLRRFRVESFSSASALPPDLFARLQREYAADGVLFVDVTVYKAYRPIAIGFRSKLASIDGQRLIWTFDNVFSSDDPAVANAARRHFLDSDQRGVPADLTHSVLQSPTRFAAYVTAAMFATLPPVLNAAADPEMARAAVSR